MSDAGKIKILLAVLDQAEKKLEIYRDHSNGQYHGGIEHTVLIRNIREARSLVSNPQETPHEQTP